MEPFSAAKITFLTSPSATDSVTAVRVWLPFPWLTRPPLACAELRVRAVAPTARTWASRRTYWVRSPPSPRGMVTTTPTRSPGVMNPATWRTRSTPIETA
jgi:hypothetical protein